MSQSSSSGASSSISNIFGGDMPEANETISSLGSYKGSSEGTSTSSSSIKEKKLSTGSLGGSCDGARPKMVSICIC